jgi:hypothetical protein
MYYIESKLLCSGRYRYDLKWLKISSQETLVSLHSCNMSLGRMCGQSEKKSILPKRFSVLWNKDFTWRMVILNKFPSPGRTTTSRNQWWYSERFVVITRQLQAAKCSLSSQPFGHKFTLLENLRFPYCCTPCKQTFVWLVCSSLGPFVKNLLFNFR